MTERDAALGQVIGAYCHCDFVAENHANAVPTELARKVSLDFVAVLGCHEEGTAWVHFFDCSFHIDQIVCGHCHLRCGQVTRRWPSAKRIQQLPRSKTMPDSTIRTLQRDIDAWIADNGGYWDEMSLLARLTEEVGELAREYNHQFGAKRKKPTEKDGSLEGELADVLWLILCMANQQGIDLEDAFEKVMTKLKVRDAHRHAPKG
jgi:NTP pyrophosphatase (non-canonical NTP hydrolase)